MAVAVDSAVETPAAGNFLNYIKKNQNHHPQMAFH
jgi:hypothetical protein